jgi:hypothetical protein
LNSNFLLHETHHFHFRCPLSPKRIPTRPTQPQNHPFHPPTRCVFRFGSTGVGLHPTNPFLSSIQMAINPIAFASCAMSVHVLSDQKNVISVDSDRVSQPHRAKKRTFYGETLQHVSSPNFLIKKNPKSTVSPQPPKSSKRAKHPVTFPAMCHLCLFKTSRTNECR